jgi:hypothetical protein
MFSSSHLRCRGAALLAISAATVSALGCAEDLRLDPEDAELETISTEPLPSGGFTTRVNASSQEEWVYFSFVSGDQVIPLDPLNSPDWDLGFQRFHIVTNGGVSGSAGASVATLVDQTFESVTAAPVDGYLPDQPDTDDGDMLANSAFESGDGWYAYDEATNRLSPRPIVYVIQTGRGAHYKLSISDYYNAAGSSGYPRFSWAEL